MADVFYIPFLITYQQHHGVTKTSRLNIFDTFADSM